MSDENRIIRIEDKIDKMSEKLNSIDSTLALQHESLKTHIKRTDLLEAAIKPLQEKDAINKWLLQFISIAAIIIGAATSIMLVLKG